MFNFAAPTRPRRTTRCHYPHSPLSPRDLGAEPPSLTFHLRQGCFLQCSRQPHIHNQQGATCSRSHKLTALHQSHLMANTSRRRSRDPSGHHFSPHQWWLFPNQCIRSNFPFANRKEAAFPSKLQRTEEQEEDRTMETAWKMTTAKPPCSEGKDKHVTWLSIVCV